MDVVALIHSVRSSFHDHRSSLDGAKSELAEILAAESDASTAKLSPDSSDDLADGLSSIHIQGRGSSPDDAKTNTPMTSSQVSDHASHETFTGSHQQQSELEGPTDATGFRKSSSNHNTQSGGYGSQSHDVNVLTQHLHHRGDGPSQYGYSGRRGQNRRHRDWNVHRTNSGGNMHMPPGGFLRFTRALHRPPLSPYPFSQYFPPFVPPTYGGTHKPPPGFGPNFPYYAALPPSLAPYMPPYGNVSAPDPELSVKIVRQVEYYFSFDNLIKDMYLRRQMDEQGWVPVRLIANFRKIKELTDNIQIISEVLQTSTVVEILGDKVRRRDDWQRWIIPRSYQLPDVPSSGIFNEPSQN
ncbi:la-related protein 1B-like [Neltuma alba]|uniref:la-related protein 1B-like n=1 Tax=Neltuma alba TaxID=207710 RepID=UPI0010A55C5A|nr:la-related protein 1B-like [Prosopis alba]